MKKVLWIVLIIIIVIICIAVASSMLNSKYEENATPKEKKYMLLSKDLGWADVVYVEENKEENIDCIIIGKVEATEEKNNDNENPETSTIGTVKIKKVFKGNVKKGKEIKVINSNKRILLEEEKTYLMYIDYDKEQEKYVLRYENYGLREVDTSKFIFNYENVRVKNYENDNYVRIKSVLPKEFFGKEIIKEHIIDIWTYILSKF